MRALPGGWPTLVVDSREQLPLNFAHCPAVIGALPSGDYSILGAEDSFAVERKSIQDLVGCVVGGNRDRFERELVRLRGYAFRAILIVGSMESILAHQYRSAVEPGAVTASLSVWWLRYGIAPVFAPSAALAAELIETWALYYVRGVRRAAKNIEMKEADNGSIEKSARV
jgi:ERCC4-type nuclease